ncbi:MAG: dihydroorotate dehydrogenase [Thermodesulfobacteriota bacterium]
MENRPDLSVSIADLRLKNPVLTASGTFGYGLEFSDLFDPDLLGGIVTKGLSLLPSPGNAPPRIVETACGMLNAIGLENIGVEAFVRDKLPALSKLSCAIIVNIYGKTADDYAKLAEILDAHQQVAALEVNVSCPNVKAGGVAFGQDPAAAAEVTRRVREKTRKPVIVKLTPNVASIAPIALAAARAGADAVSLINTITGMAVDIKTRRPKLANITGGLSGPAIKPVGLRMVREAALALKKEMPEKNVPVIGIGGIVTAEDALEYLLVGASAVQVGTASFVDPLAARSVLEGIEAFFAENKIAGLSDFVGSLQA